MTRSPVASPIMVSECFVQVDAVTRCVGHGPRIWFRCMPVLGVGSPGLLSVARLANAGAGNEAVRDEMRGSCVSRVEGTSNNLRKTYSPFYRAATGSCSQPDYGSISLYRHRMPLPLLRQAFATETRPSRPVLGHQIRSQAGGLFPRERVRWIWGLWMRV